MKESKPLALEYELMEAIEELKKKTVVTVDVVDDFHRFIIRLSRDLGRLRESRDNWRNKYEKLKQTKDI